MTYTSKIEAAQKHLADAWKSAPAHLKGVIREARGAVSNDSAYKDADRCAIAAADEIAAYFGIDDPEKREAYEEEHGQPEVLSVDRAESRSWLLAWGGPAVRIECDVVDGEHGGKEREGDARLQSQDWLIPWRTLPISAKRQKNINQAADEWLEYEE